MHVCSAYNFLEFMNSFKPIYRYCHPYPQGQGPRMSGGLLGRKEDGVFLTGIFNLNFSALTAGRIFAGLGTRTF